MKIIVASTNPVKVNAVKQAFQMSFPNEDFDVQGVKASSKVSEQPMSEEETRLGARNRVINLLDDHPEADFITGIEGGIRVYQDDLYTFAVMHIRSRDGKESESMTADFRLPPKVTELVLSGMELGHANDKVFHQENSKQAGGAVGIFTNDLITRTTYYEHAMILALIPFKNPELY